MSLELLLCLRGCRSLGLASPRYTAISPSPWCRSDIHHVSAAPGCPQRSSGIWLEIPLTSCIAASCTVGSLDVGQLETSPASCWSSSTAVSHASCPCPPSIRGLSNPPAAMATTSAWCASWLPEQSADMASATATSAAQSLLSGLPRSTHSSIPRRGGQDRRELYSDGDVVGWQRGHPVHQRSYVRL